MSAAPNPPRPHERTRAEIETIRAAETIALDAFRRLCELRDLMASRPDIFKGDWVAGVGLKVYAFVLRCRERIKARRKV
jgi:hypothetical protein